MTEKKDNILKIDTLKGTIDMSEIAAGQAVIELLRAEGVEYVFGVTGLTTNSMVTQMYGREDIKFIDTRHEEGAILMAYGYSKST